MRYDAYRLPGVKWKWVGVGKSPEPDHWPEHVSIEGTKVKTIRGKGWGIARALYECPECGKARVRLYSASESAEQAKQAMEQANAQSAAERTRTPGRVRVACASHWPKSKTKQDDALLAEAKASVLERCTLHWGRASELRQYAADLRLSLA